MMAAKKTSTPERAGAAGHPMSLASSMIKDKGLLLQRRVHLVDVATRMLIERGFSAVSVNEIADEAGISIGSLYKYVRSKQDLLWLVVDSIYRELEAAFDPALESQDPLDQFVSTFASFLRASHAVRRGMLLIYREFSNLSADSQREFLGRDQLVFTQLERIVARGNDSGAWNADPRLAALNIYAVADSWTLKGWAMRDVTLEMYTRQQTALMLQMLGADAQRSRRRSR